ncbi:D-amino acid dehydrogenase [Polaromonas sp. JS666]|uniref:D-amino acid dehydrogenase n=1 Tax=Polaromonas sp. (strain JS666 / ATCC BAA-500) TaxID=296591 RepID=UPI0000464548|nr:D-amino acid dehydrogenase [Polaromonas sp. JS666]ABE43929.1 D-amino-acid dehydrogenase [Polaromonas sp. JS666]
MHVCVLGAGIVGLATAYSLRRAGHEVTVLDRADPGSGASGGNGAQLSYSYVQPLADPGIWRQLPNLLLSPTSPLKLRPRLDPRQWLWGAQFLAACKGSTSRSTTARLLELAALSRQTFDAMMNEEQLDCDFSTTGKLVLYPDQPSFAAAHRQMLLQRELGSRQEAVGADRCVEIEPALASRHRHIAGAIYTPSECAADCLKTCRALLAVLRRQGVRFLLGSPIEHLVLRGGSVVAAATPQGPVEADQYVMALGAHSPRLARTLGVHLPVYPLKGYSITVEVGDEPHAAPSVSVTDSARKVVFARIGSRLRVAGMAELSGYDTAVCPAQIASLKATTQMLFPQCNALADLSPWAGMRPATPTGLPIIGKHAKGPRNLLFNTGHGALGFTLAFGSAQRINRLLSP